MKRLVYILALTFAFSINASGQKISINSGGAVLHTIAYENSFMLKYTVHNADYEKIVIKYQGYKDFSRVVYRPRIGLEYSQPLRKNNYLSASLFIGQDCLKGDIFGSVFTFGKSLKHIDFGLLAGGYFADGKLWQSKGFGYKPFFPVIGIEVTPKINLSERLSIGLSNRITPLMTLHDIKITYKL